MKKYEQIKKGMVLNGKYFRPDELVSFAESRTTSAETADWESAIFSFILSWYNDQDSITQKTSGTTGIPKTITLRKEYMEYSAIQTCRFFGIDEKTTCLLCLPVRYIGGKMMVVRAMLSGANLLFSKPLGRPFTDLKQRIDFAAITPYQLHQSVDDLMSWDENCTLIVGGGAVSRELEQRIQKLSCSIYSTYGMTETSSHIAVQRLNGPDRSNVFTVLGDTKISTGEDNRLLLENPDLFEGLLKTNDKVEIIGTKRFRWIGRLDNAINSGGIKIQPEEVENTIADLPDREFALSAVRDEALGEQLVLVLEGPSMTAEDENKLLLVIKERVPPYHSPDRVIYLKSLPLTPNGKLARKQLKDLLAEI